MPDACVLITVYNGAPWIEEALDSALAQEGTSPEILVVDDGSTDATPEILARRAASADGRIRVLPIGRSGLSRARNLGFEHVTAPFVTCLDADDRMHPRRVQLECDALRAHPDAVLSFSGRWNFEDGADVGYWSFTPGAFGVSRGMLFSRLADPISAMLDAGEYPGTDACTCRTEWARGPGRFDPSFPTFMDGERWLRSLHSTPVVYVAAPLYQRRIHPSAMSGDWRTIERALFAALDGAHARWSSYTPGQRRRIRRFEKSAGVWLSRRAAGAAGRGQGVAFLLRHATRLHSPLWWSMLAWYLVPSFLHDARRGRPADAPVPARPLVPLSEVMAPDPARAWDSLGAEG
jgi:glycosyltransferase involved in cell wall biosynthesis